MKKLLAAAAAVSMLAVAAPASAQYRDYDRGRDYRGDRDYDRGGINAEQRQLERRIYQGMRTGRLSEREAGRLRAEFGHIVRLEARYRRNGLTRWERVDLNRRLDRLEMLVTAEMRDRNNYRG
jgi:hypothetical protein